MDHLPLTGARVLELGTTVSAAFAGRWLAGFGADVVRVDFEPEALTADEAVYLLPGKRRVTADPALVRDLAGVADIIVEDIGPAKLAALGLALPALREARPALIGVSISPFGLGGPYEGYTATNATTFAMGGIMSLTGSPHHEPLVTGGSQALYIGGLHGFSAAVTAYYGTLIHGEGDLIDISMQEVMSGILESMAAAQGYLGGPVRLRSGNNAAALWAIYPCADGYAGICAIQRQVPSLFEMLGYPQLKEPRFSDPEQRLANNDELIALLYQWFASHTKAEILAAGAKSRVPMGAVLTPLELLESPSLLERDFFDRVGTEGGEARVPGRPFLGLGWQAGALHTAGADTDSIVADWLGGSR
jgi:crotonobetainyl-CoA:carnitine CoA-transferase CaiB-like acyl-CoA transferase